MSARPLSVLVCAWALLATALPIRADAPPDHPTAHPLHESMVRPVPDCPHCRKATSLGATEPAASGTSASAPGPGPEKAPLDRNVTPARASAASVPVPVPPPSSIPLPGATIAATDPEPQLPELPEDLKDAPASATPSRPNRTMPEPVFMPYDRELESLLAAPPIFTTGAPDPAWDALLDSPPAATAQATATATATTSRADQGPTARIVIATPQQEDLAMPPPSAGPLAPSSTDGSWLDPYQRSGPSHRNGFTYLPVMLGDQSPPSRFSPLAGLARPSIPGQPPAPPSPFARPGRPAAMVPWARGFKIADNQSPMPQDRVFYSFNYFNNMNGDVNRRLGSAVSDMQVYRQLLGIEKTFWRGNASVGLRLPIDTLWTNSGDPSLRGNDTSVGNLTVFTKFLLYDNPEFGSLLSGGLAVTAPTGPASFAGSRSSVGLRSTQLQPYLGYIFRRGDFYLQGFSAIDVPTDSRDVTMWYNDLALGYFVYQSADPSDFLSAVVPTFELHLNDPLNHRGALRANDPFGTPDVLDLTFGTSFILRKRLVATVGCAFPVTGPRPFDIEALAMLNFYYGRYGMAQPWPMPPVSR